MMSAGEPSKQMKKKCVVCGIKAKDDANIDLPGITFNFLEGQPIICERCIFTGITHGAVPFQEDVEALLE